MSPRRRLSAPLVVLTSLVALAGCGSTGTVDGDGGSGTGGTVAGAPPDLTALDLAVTGGCGDAYFWAATADEQHAVTIAVDVGRDRPPGDDTRVQFDVDDAEVTGRYLEGRNLVQQMCSDLIIDSEITAAAPIVEGGGLVEIATTRDENGFSRGTLTASGLVTEDGRQLPDVSVTTGMVGFYAG